MSKLRNYAAVAAASLAVTGGGTLGYEHFAEKAAPGITACANKYLEQPDLLERCEDHVPFTGGTYRMAVLALGGIISAAVSTGFAISTIRKTN